MGVDSTATVLVWAMAAMAMEVLAMDTARGPLMPRPMPTLDMVAFMATVLVWAMAMAVTATDCGARSKQNQIPRLTISYNTPNDLTGLYKHPLLETMLNYYFMSRNHLKLCEPVML